MFRNFIYVVCAGFILTGCLHSSGQSSGGEAIDIMLPEEAVINTVVQEYKVPSVRSFAAGSVQVFSLDRIAPVATSEVNPSSTAVSLSIPNSRPDPVSRISLNPLESVSTGDVNVQVFSFNKKEAVPAPVVSSQTVGPVNTALPDMVSEPNKVSDDQVEVEPEVEPAIIYFEHDLSALGGESKQIVLNLASNYDSSARGNVLVAGYASMRSSVSDVVQRKIVNLKVSMNRAFSVARALIEGGVPAERIETKAYGESELSKSTPDMDVETASRRVEISGLQ